MKTKQEFIDKLNADDLFQDALASASSEEERKHISAFVEGFVAEFANILGPLVEQLKADDTFAQSVGQSISGANEVVNPSEPVVSGSQG